MERADKFRGGTIKSKSLLERLPQSFSKAILAGSLYAVTGTSHIDFEQLADQHAHIESQQLQQELERRIQIKREEVRWHPELIMENDADPGGEAVVSMIIELPDSQNTIPPVLERAIHLDPRGIAVAFMRRYPDKAITPLVLEKTLPESAAAINNWGEKIEHKPWSLNLFEEAALLSPRGVRGGMTNPGTRGYLDASIRPEIKKIIEISDNTSGGSGYGDEYRYAALLLDDIVKGNLTIEQACAIAHNKTQLFQRVLDISHRPKHLASQDIKYVVDELSMEMLSTINQLHEVPDDVRFKSVENFEAKGLYALIVLGESEAFTSTFNGLFNRFVKKIDSGKTFLESVGYDHFRTFIKMLATYGRLNDFLQTMSPDEGRELLRRFIGNLEKEPDMLSQGVSVVDMIMGAQDEVLLDGLRDLLKKEYTRVQNTDDERAKLLYGILVGMYGTKTNSEDEWIRHVTEQYHLPDIGRVTPDELFTKDGKNIQQYFFYNDADGQASYENFLSQYTHDPAWSIEDHDSFIRITSKQGPRILEVYANKPATEKEGVEAVNVELKSRKEVPTVIVHRGHSYHARDTIDRINTSARIVYLGGCGGYSNIDVVLSRSPLSHIISTKGTGMMRVNDPLLKMLNQAILTGKPIVWTHFWQQAQNRIGSDEMTKYVPPHKSISIFLKAYYYLAAQKEYEKK